MTEEAQLLNSNQVDHLPGGDMAPRPMNSWKKVFLWSMIGSLSASALIAIVVFLGGDFGAVEIRTLLTTLSLGAFSVVGLCQTVNHGSKVLTRTGIAISAATLLCTLGLIWLDDVAETFVRITIAGMVLSFLSAHIALVLLAKPVRSSMRIVRTTTFLFIGIVGVMLLYLVFRDFSNELPEMFWRWLGVVAVLDVLGTIVTPILKKVQSN